MEEPSTLALPQTSADNDLSLPVPGFFGPMSYDAFDTAIQRAEGWKGPGDISVAGAKGRYQVIKDTATNPGFGISGMSEADYNSENQAELDRVGKAYGRAMWDKYSVDGRPYPALSAAAYNWGTGNVDNLIKSFGDPRTGKVSWGDFFSKMPLETRNYVYGKGKGPPPAPTMVASNVTTPDQAPIAQGGQSLQMIAQKPPISMDDLKANMVRTMLMSLLSKGMGFQPVDYNPQLILRGYREAAGSAPREGPSLGSIPRVAPAPSIEPAKAAYGPGSIPSPLGRPRGG